MNCEAKGPGWKCDREATVRKLCPSHYQQMTRNGEDNFTPLKDRHGKHPADLVKVTFRARAVDVDSIGEAAKALGKNVAELYRAALAQFAERLGGKR